ncbi:MAG: hypothetical protein IT424_15180 [Pirellulales bacterium]|nr:hypothetical protein [Pirellulales bacterium]
MARKYAAIMASVGMTLVLLRALHRGGGLEAALTSGVVWMVTFGVVGYLLGSIARATVDDSVRQSMQYEIAIAYGRGPGAGQSETSENGFSNKK